MSVNKFFIGHSNNGKIRYQSSSGGIGTELIKYLLSTTDYNTTITFVFDKEKCGYVPKFIHRFEEMNICGSIYQDIDIVSYIRQNYVQIKDGVVITCMPCQVKTIRLFLKKKNIKNFIISFACSGQTILEGTWCYYKYMNIDKHDVACIQYRGNGWPSGIQVKLNNGHKIYRDNYSEPWRTIHQSRLYRPKRCLMCKEPMSFNADISLADPWLKEYKKSDAIGNTLFVINTERGASILSVLRKKNIVSVIQASYQDYKISQEPNISAKDNCKNHKYLNQLLGSVAKEKCWYKKIVTSSLSMLKIHVQFISLLQRFI